MKHAGPETLELIEPFLAELRGVPALREKKPGTFYRGSRSFLHFHEDPAGIFVDVRLDESFERVEVTTEQQQRELLGVIREKLGGS